MSLDRFKVGDRVQRRSQPLNPYSRLLHGVVVRRYAIDDGLGTFGRDYPEVYEVRWDSQSKTEMGYLPHGLEPETRT